MNMTAFQKAVAVSVLTGLLLLLPGCSRSQPDWSQWSDALPDYVNQEQHQIEERREYRSRSLNTTTSTEGDTLPGWELYATLDSKGEYGKWSEWSSSQVTASETRQVEKATEYRSRDREYRTSDSAAADGWNQGETTYTPGEFGAWSDWSATAVSPSADCEVQTKTQYRSRSIRYESGYTEWSAWSAWSSQPVAPNDTRQVQTQEASPGEYQYRYRTRTYVENMAVYGEWSSYSDTVMSPSSILDVQTRTMYRSRSRQQIPVYHFWRWGDWSDWNGEAVEGDWNKEVETREVYRYRDQITEVTYCFRGWGDWSEYTDTPIAANETVQVEVKTEYRFKDKEG